MSARLLILRHAERPPIPEGEIGAAVALTLAGRVAARRFGEQLAGSLEVIRTSPLRRCIETAQEIAAAKDFDPERIEQTKVLGDPGIFVEDPELAWKRWREIGHEAVCRELALAETAAPGFRDPVEVVRLMRAEIECALVCTRGLTIWITHDVILAALAQRLFCVRALDDGWPNFLGNLEVKRDRRGELQGIWRPLGGK